MKKEMKRYFASMALTAAMTAAMSFPAFAARIAFSDPSGNVGDEITVNMKITGSDEKLPEDEFAVIDELCRVSGVEIPKAVEEIRNAQIRHKLECDVQDMKKTVAKILGI